MVDLVPKGKIESNSLTDSLLIGVVKAIEERALMGVIGDGTAMSGAIKLAGGGIAQSMTGGKTGKIIGSAFVIDGIEDLVNAFVVPMLYGGQSKNSGESVW